MSAELALGVQLGTKQEKTLIYWADSTNYHNLINNTTGALTSNSNNGQGSIDFGKNMLLDIIIFGGAEKPAGGFYHVPFLMFKSGTPIHFKVGKGVYGSAGGNSSLFTTYGFNELQTVAYGGNNISGFNQIENGVKKSYTDDVKIYGEMKFTTGGQGVGSNGGFSPVGAPGSATLTTINAVGYASGNGGVIFGTQGQPKGGLLLIYAYT
jgi:hypothetical protein